MIVFSYNYPIFCPMIQRVAEVYITPSRILYTELQRADVVGNKYAWLIDWIWLRCRFKHEGIQCELPRRPMSVPLPRQPYVRRQPLRVCGGVRRGGVSNPSLPQQLLLRRAPGTLYQGEMMISAECPSLVLPFCSHSSYVHLYLVRSRDNVINT